MGALVFIFPAVLLTVNRADSLIMTVLALTGLYTSLRSDSNIEFSAEEKLLMGAFASMFLVAVAAYLFGSQTTVGFHVLGRYLRFLLFIPVYMALRSIPPRRETASIGIALGAIVMGIYALVSHFHLDVERAGGVSGPIEFGDIALVSAISSLSLPIIFAGTTYRKYLYWLTAAAIVCGLIASFLSGTRGGWIALPVLAMLAFLTLAHISMRHLWRYAAGLLILISLSIYLAPHSMLVSRVSDAVDQTQIFSKFRQLAHNGDIKAGCQDNADTLTGIVSVMKLYGLSQELNAKIANDEANLRNSPFGKDCKSGYVINVSNTSNVKSLQFSVPRSVMDVYGYQKIEFVVKGQGVLSLYDGTVKKVSFDSQSQYARVVFIDSTSMDDSEPPTPWPVFTLGPGAQLSFAPYSLYPGEYTSFYALGPVGTRLELWAAAWVIFQSHPWLGAGTGAFMENVYPFVAKGLVAPHIAAYDHAHNDYLNIMACEGLFGLTAFMLIILYPMKIYLNALFRSRQAAVRSTALCGLLMVSGILIFSCTESLFVHSLVIGWYVIMTALFCSLIRTYNLSHEPE